MTATSTERAIIDEPRIEPTGSRRETPPVGIVRHDRRSRRARAGTVTIALMSALLAAGIYSISVGDFPIPLRDVFPAVVGRGGDDADFIVNTLRLPRVLTGMLVGIAFGMSGGVFQTISRNPLASPDIIGITAGASASAVFVIVMLEGGSNLVAAGALVGALVTALVIYGLAWRHGVSPYRLVLIGIGIAAVLTSVTSYLITRAELYDAQRAMVWLTGSLNARGWDDVRTVGVALAVLFPAVLALSRPLGVLRMGDEVAKGLGVAVERSRLGLIVSAVLLAAIATSVAGPIAFVAFMSPPIARRLVRSLSAMIAFGVGGIGLIVAADFFGADDYLKAAVTVVVAAVVAAVALLAPPIARRVSYTTPSLFVQGLVGAVLVVEADVVARRLFAPTEMPVGVVTGLVGGPFLLWLLTRVNRVGG